ncbi:MAG: ATP-binding cassette domain-containing protein [Alphaproteobacteria bacterium]|nr:ATP-binding cassette domain-containing protein [Alphaproteobacteria bacterium]
MSDIVDAGAERRVPTGPGLDRLTVAALIDAPAAPDAAPDLRSALGGFRALTDVAACLVPLLESLHWRGDPRQVAEALPHFADSLDLVSLRNVMAHLEYRSSGVRTRMGAVDPRLLPCLFIADDGAAMVVHSVDQGVVTLFDGTRRDWVTRRAPGPEGTAYVFQPVDDATQGIPPGGWVRSVAARFRPLFGQIALLTALLYCIALVSPLFVMMVYDRVIATASLSTLWALLAAAVLAILGEVALRSVRGRMFAYIAVRMNVLVAPAVFRQILDLPPPFTERAKIGSQLTRLKDFEYLKEVFSGHLAMTAIELPFVLIFIVAIAVLGGWLAAIPILCGLIYVGLAALLVPTIRKTVRDSAGSFSARQEFLVEMVTQMRALRTANAEATWLQRYRDLSAAVAMANYRSAGLSALMSSVGQGLMILAGVITIAVGAEFIVLGMMSIGALVATMILVWRVLGPMQQAFIAYSRVEQMRSAIQQLDQLMALRTERGSGIESSPGEMRGEIQLGRVSMRYTADGDPVLLGVSCDIRPGELVALVGPNGAGKSSLLKVIMGLYQPQAGTVRIDDLDIRQRDPIELRKVIAYVPQDEALFFGTIAQNLRLSEPTASDEDLRRACADVGILAEIEALPRGFDTRIGDQRSASIPAGLRHGISIARAYLRKTKILLLDEAVDMLDREGDAALARHLQSLKGKVTVIIVTHRPSHMKLADRLLVLDGGVLRFNGPPAEVLPQLPKNFL